MELEFNAVRGTAGGVTSGMRLTFDHLSKDERDAVRARVKDPAFREQTWLVFNRVPYDLAMSIDAETRRSMCLTTAVLASVDDRHAGTASGFNSAVALTGGLVAPALAGLVMSRAPAAAVDAFRVAALVGAGAALASGSIAFVTLPSRRRRGGRG